MRSECRPNIICIVLMAIALLSTQIAVASAQPDDAAKAEASKRFQKGVELYQAGDIRAALIEFRRAYRIAPTYHLLYNIGQASAELRDYVEAYNSFSQYLREGAAEVNSERRATVEREISRLEGYLARLTLEVSEADAEISVDGSVVGRSPLSKALLVSAGRRRVVVSKAGFAVWERSVDVAGEDEERLSAELISNQAGTRDPTFGTPPRRDAERRRLGTPFWICLGATAAFGAGTVVAALLTRRAERDYEDELAKVPNTAAAIDKAAKKVERSALVTDIGIGLTAAAAITTIVFAVRGAASKNATDDDSIQVSASPSGIALSGRF